MVEDDATSHKLPSIEFYNILDSKFIPCKYCNVCDIHENTFKEQPTWVKNLCYHLVRNLEIVSNIDNTNAELKKKSCDAFISWIDDKIRNNDGYTDQSKYLEIIRKMHFVWNDIINKYSGDEKDKICSTAYSAFDFEKRKKKKLMDDYCENYLIISKELDKEDADCKPYYKYLNESSSIHTEIMKGCINNVNTKYCPPNGDDCRFYPPSIFLKKKPCMILKEPRVALIKEEEGMKCEPCPLCPIGKIKDDGASDIDLESYYASVPSGMTSFDFSDKRAITLLIFTVWGIFLTLFLFYKKTPFGSLLNNFLRRRRVIKHNLNENEFHEFVNGNYDTVDSNMENIRYDLAYNPV
ncbi:PIR Superfamily Protein [Plasmodium ovale wallikeri]|uniref:Plasmodium vivax Vir protein, putative n=2 Tax=Plasmodium ovale TaxID=36330 RepID=A0A1C3KGS0_PLAOA|nr:PIR Superfamily Protein [Plasmodium ovale wallikeri]SBT72873.1 Plasmodium vivax Vir protein, putative [Plasmodium ovale]